MSFTDVAAYVGVITGISGLIIHFVKFLREIPRLKVEAEEGFHWTKQNTETSFVRIGLRVDNIGDRSTRITSYRLHLSCKTPESFFYSISEPLIERVHVKAHDSVFIEFKHEIYGEIADQTIKCFYTLQHTHGKIHITVFSQKSSEPISTPFHGHLVQTLPKNGIPEVKKSDMKKL